MVKHGFIVYFKDQSTIAGLYSPYRTSLISQQQRYEQQVKSSYNYYLYIIAFKNR